MNKEQLEVHIRQLIYADRHKLPLNAGNWAINIDNISADDPVTGSAGAMTFGGYNSLKIYTGSFYKALSRIAIIETNGYNKIT